LKNKSGLSQIIIEALLDSGTCPRNVFSDEGLLLILGGVNCNPGEDPEDMVAIRMLLSEHCIITARYRRVMAIQDVTKAIDANKSLVPPGIFWLWSQNVASVLSRI
jgi:zinc transporter